MSDRPVSLNSLQLAALYNSSSQNTNGITSLSGEFDTLSGEFDTLSGEFDTLSYNVNTSMKLEPASVNIGTTLNFIDSLGERMYYPYYVYKLIMDHSGQIQNYYQSHHDPSGQAKSYSAILDPYINARYGTNKVDDLFGVRQLDITTTDQGESIFYIRTGKYNMYQGLRISQVPNVSDRAIFLDSTNNTTAILLNFIDEHSRMPSCGFYSLFMTYEFTNGPKQSFFIVMRDILDSTKWIAISSGVDYSTTVENPDTVYLNNNAQLIIDGGNNTDIGFNNLLYSLYINAGSSGIWRDTDVDYKWTYKNVFNINEMICIQSSKYPQWNNNYVGQCFIPGSNFNVTQMMEQILTKLNSFPTLLAKHVVSLTYQMENDTYLAFIQMDTNANGDLIFRQRDIKLNDLGIYGPTVNVVGDTSIRGALNVSTSLAEYPIIQTDSVKNTTCFYEKVGINVQPFQVQGMLDIDNLSNTQIVNLVENFAPYQLNSYYVINALFDDFTSSNMIDGSFQETVIQYFTSPNSLYSYTNDVAIFRAPIEDNTTAVTFLHSPDQLFGFNNCTLDSSYSMVRISKIINEIKQMVSMNDISGSIPTFTFSFVELLNDGINNYMCSIRAAVTQANDHHDVLFVMSFLPVQSIMNNTSYKTRFTKIVEAFSSLNRMLNYSCLLLQTESNNIFNTIRGPKHDSVTSFTYHVNNGVFNERFGLPTSYVYSMSGDVFQTNSIPVSSNSVAPLVRMFIELHPEQNGQLLSKFYLPNTDIPVTHSTQLALSYYQNYYGFDSSNQNFIIWYQWERQEKIAFQNLLTINGTNYLIGTGIDLVDFIDKSVLSHGDVISAGQLTVSDNYDQDIFKVDTVNKTISNMYKVGVGMKNPNSTLDVNDSGMQDILNVIGQLADSMSCINYNYQKLVRAINYDVSNGHIHPTFGQIDPSQNTVTALFNPSGNILLDRFTNIDNTVITQSVDSYYSVKQIDPINENNIKEVYFWLYPNWQGYPVSKIIDPNNQSSVSLAISGYNKFINTNLLFNKSFQIWTTPWVFGQKIKVSRSYVNNNGNIFSILNGVNLQNSGLRYQTNQNNYLLTEYLGAYSTYLNYILLQNQEIFDISSTIIESIPNYEKVSNYMIDNLSQYPLSKSSDGENADSCLGIGYFLPYGESINFGLNYFNATIYDYNLSSPTIDICFNHLPENASYTLINQNGHRPNVSNEILYQWTNLFYNINLKYPHLQPGDYGIISFENYVHDYVSVFYCYGTHEQGNNTMKDIVFLYKKINDIIVPTINVRGDAKVMGDMTVSSVSKDYVNIDPDYPFFGIGTNVRTTNYKTMSDYVSGKFFIPFKHNFIVSGSTYPNAVIQVNNDANLYNFNYDYSAHPYHGYDNDTINGLHAISAFSVKRTGKYGLFHGIGEASSLCDMLAYVETIRSQLYSLADIGLNSMGISGEDVRIPYPPIQYGVDITYEVEDPYESNIVKLGTVGMTLEGSYTNDNQDSHIPHGFKSGFNVKAWDSANDNSDEYQRSILYVDYGGNATTNALNLKGDPIFLSDRYIPTVQVNGGRNYGTALTVENGNVDINNGSINVGGDINVSGSIHYNIETIDASCSLTSPLLRLYTVNDTDGQITIILPNPSSDMAGVFIKFKRVISSSNSIVFRSEGNTSCIIGESTISTNPSVSISTNTYSVEFAYTDTRILQL